MKKVIIVLLVLVIGTFTATQSKALIIDLGESTMDQVTKIPAVAAEDMEDFFSQMVPWVMGTLINDGEETVVFDLISASCFAGDLFSMFTSEFSSPIELDPGEVFSAPISEIVAVYLNFEVGDFVPAPVGMTSGIYQIDFEFTVDGVSDYISYIAPPGELLWPVEVVSTNPVPEPATVLLFGAGLTGLAAIRRKKK